MSDYIVQPCSPAEAEAILARLGAPQQAKENLLKGYVDAVCREADGAVAWEVHQSNLITDFNRRRFMLYPMNGGTRSLQVFTSPSTETPLVGRTVLADDGSVNSAQSGTPPDPTYDSATLTKTWSITFSAPAANRSIGTIGLCAGARSANFGIYTIAAYTLISPAKVQTTSQTLEILYRVTLTPSY